MLDYLNCTPNYKDATRSFLFDARTSTDEKETFQVVFVLTILHKNKTLFCLREEESVIVAMSCYDYDFGNIPSIPLNL